VSKTELEEDLRATFERAAASVPLAPDLTSRATTGAKRAQRRTWIASGGAAAAVAAIAAVSFGLHGAGTSSSPEPAAGTAAPAPATKPAGTTPVTTMQALSGTWRPVRLSGFTTLQVGRPEDPTLTFTPDGTWTGSDGCNGISGTFSIGQHGEFSSRANGQRLIECGNVPHTLVLASAKRISTDQLTLRFFAGDGREVATYARAR
jgi:heat shock protein HslJ